MSYNYKTISNNPEERQRVLYPYCYWENAFTEEEITAICNLMSLCPLDDACISSSSVKETDSIVSTDTTPSPSLDENVRRSKVSFHSLNDQNSWIFDRLNKVIEQVNSRWYNFDINGYDQFQYTEYHSSNNGCYGWHSDIFLGPLPKDSYTETRKLSLSLILNDPDIDFEGGELQFGHESNYEAAQVKKGTIVLFPSFELHRVSPVTRGIRKSLVVWVLGPKWK